MSLVTGFSLNFRRPHPWEFGEQSLKSNQILFSSQDLVTQHCSSKPKLFGKMVYHVMCFYHTHPHT